ncbi:hypothetical protein GCM10025868_22730 [Angustibacter aerolatus]|uniref:Transcriptional regulator LacI/GalR-like sensor domain-containing protein n=1 Tax=Angustibacter aerolatus TaxID=1162965 RepID=A0ABQ6JFS0_9ACTN|nr:hypothetical protein GCM10025868_22730 [Angustibacter aerolatus]
MRHLVELGHTRIAHLAGPETTSTGVARARAFRHAVRDLGVDDDPALVARCSQWSEAEGRARSASLLDARLGFTGVVAGNDLQALGCYDVFAERGIDCPRDLSVVGFNDMPFLDKPAAPAHDGAGAALRARHRGRSPAAGVDPRPRPARAVGAAAADARRPAVDRPGAEAVSRPAATSGSVTGPTGTGRSWRARTP